MAMVSSAGDIGLLASPHALERSGVSSKPAGRKAAKAIVHRGRLLPVSASYRLPCPHARSVRPHTDGEQPTCRISFWLSTGRGRRETGRRSVPTATPGCRSPVSARRPSGTGQTIVSEAPRPNAHVGVDRGGSWGVPAFPVGQSLWPLFTNSGGRPRPVMSRTAGHARRPCGDNVETGRTASSRSEKGPRRPPVSRPLRSFGSLSPGTGRDGPFTARQAEGRAGRPALPGLAGSRRIRLHGFGMRGPDLGRITVYHFLTSSRHSRDGLRRASSGSPCVRSLSGDPSFGG